MDQLPSLVLDNIVQRLDLPSLRNLKLTSKAVNSKVRQLLYRHIVIKCDYVSDILPVTQPRQPVDQLHIAIDRHNITTLMACDDHPLPFIVDLLPLVRNVYISGLKPAPTGSSDNILNKKFIDQLFDRLISSLIPSYASQLEHVSVVGNQFEYIPDSSPLYKLVPASKSWSFDLPQTPLTGDFILYALQSPTLVDARIVVMSEFFVDDDAWLTDQVVLPPRLRKLAVEADVPGKVCLSERTSVYNQWFDNCSLTSLTLTGLILDTKLFEAIPQSIDELTIAKCDIVPSKRGKPSKLAVNHLILDKDQELASSAVLVTAEKLDRISISSVHLDTLTS